MIGEVRSVCVKFVHTSRQQRLLYGRQLWRTQVRSFEADILGSRCEFRLAYADKRDQKLEWQCRLGRVAVSVSVGTAQVWDEAAGFCT
jgi:hypothetical protein